MSEREGRVLVTGGTGFFGKALVEALVAGGERVRVLARKRDASMESLDVEWEIGSILDESTCERAVEGVSGIYHLAGIVHHDRSARDKVFATNVEGTRRLLEAVAAAGRPRVVVASSSGTVGVSKDPAFVAGDDSPYAFGVIHAWPYYLSKVHQEETARRLAERHGLEVVLVRPSLLLGPGDDRFSSTREVKNFLEGRIPVVLSGGLSYVDVRDLAPVTIAAMRAGRPGDSYLVGAENLTVAEFMKRLAAISGVQGPRLAPPDWATVAAGWVGKRVCDLLRVEAAIDPVVIEMGQHFWYIDSTKARRELGFAPRSLSETLRETVEYIRANARTEERSSARGVLASLTDRAADSIRKARDLFASTLARRGGRRWPEGRFGR